MNRLLLPLLISCLLVSPGAYAVSQGGEDQGAASPGAAEAAKARDDVIARVGDETITFTEISTILNSSAVVGVSIPAVGSPERDTARIAVLDKLISTNLTYLDALKQGVDRDPQYLADMDQFRRGILAGLYRQRQMAGDIPVSETEVRTYLEQNVAAGTELTDDVRLGITAKIRRQKLQARLAFAHAHLRDGIDVRVYPENLVAAGDKSRVEDTPVAEVDGKPITWGEVRVKVIAAGRDAAKTDPLATEDDGRVEAMQREIDLRLMAAKAEALGLDQDRVYRARFEEYRKSHLVNLYRGRLIAAMEPNEETLAAYYAENKARFVQPEARKVQMVVVGSREQADALKAKIEAGSLTMYQAAQQYSIAVRAKQDLGEVGWIIRGTTVPALDEAIFTVGPGKIGGPVETPAGWHLVSVQDVQEAKFDDFDDPVTKRLTRREFLNDRLNQYAVNLRKTEFPVVVYEDVILRRSRQEANAVAQLAEKAQQPGSVTEQRMQTLGRMIKP